MKQPVEGHPNLLKDPETGVIVNQDDSERSRYRLARNQARMNQNNSVELESLRDEIDEIKSLLQQLLNK
jgi:Tfp pilus assembly protein PilO